MNLYTHQPYWLMKNGIISTCSRLDKNINTDVVIMGAGISGALAAYYLRNTGSHITVVDRRHIAMGSTAASTAFLQYEIDTPLVKLRNYAGEQNAVRCYELCRQAIYDIRRICNTFKPKFDFHLRPSLQHASYKKDRDELHSEYEMRKKYGFDVEWLEPQDIRNYFGFEAPGAILSADGGEVDAYMLTHTLLGAVSSKGHNVYTNTNVTEITHNQRGVTLTTDTQCTIKAKKLIIACGYESLKYIPKKIAEIRTTYALVSEPVPKQHLWHKNSLVWETADPYTYFRIVSGNRILVGGKDDNFHHPHIPASAIKRKSAMLVHDFSRKMKDISIRADFSWSGAFAVTKDGLPYIGTFPERPHTYFALGYGGNGITFSVLAAQIIRNMILRKKDKNAALFSFNR